MKLAVEIDIRKTGDGFEATGISLRNLGKGAEDAGAGLDKVKTKAEGAGKGAEKAKDSLEEMKHTLEKIAAGLGLEKLIHEAFELGEALFIASRRTGMSVETLSVLKLVAEKSGTSIEAVARGAQLLARNVGDAQTGNRKLAISFDAIDKAAGAPIGTWKKTNDILGLVGKGLSSVKDEAARNALAYNVLGRSAGELRPFLEDVAGGLDDLTEAAVRNGTMMSTAEAEAIDKFDAMLRTWKNQTLVIVGNLADAFNQLAEQLGQGLPDAFTKAINPANLLVNAIRLVIGAVIEQISVIQMVMTTLGAFGDLVSKVMANLLTDKPFKDKFAQMKADAKEQLAQLRADLDAQNIASSNRISAVFEGPTGARPADKPRGNDDDEILRQMRIEAEAQAAAMRQQSEIARKQAIQATLASLKMLLTAQDKEIAQAQTLADITANEMDQAEQRNAIDEIENNALMKKSEKIADIIEFRKTLNELEDDRAGLDLAQRVNAEATRHVDVLQKLITEQQKLTAETEKWAASANAQKIAKDKGMPVPAMAGVSPEEARRIQKEITAAKLREDELYLADLDNLQIGAEAKDRVRQIAQTKQLHADQIALAEAQKKFLLGLFSDINTAITSGLTEAIEAVFEGRSLKDAASNFAASLRKAMASSLAGLLDEALASLKAKATGVPGHRDVRTGEWVPATTGSMGAQAAYTGIQAGAAIYGMRQAAPTQTRGQAVMGGAAQGASIGSAAGPYGAIAGAVIGAAYGAVFQAIAAGGKARYQVSVGSNGEIQVAGFGAANASDVSSAVAQLNATLKASMDSVNAIILAFPKAISQQLQQMDPTVLKEGTIGEAVRHVRTFAISIWKKSFAGGMTGDELKHFNDVELPKMVYDAYAPIFKEGLSQMGVTEAKLKELFAQMPGFDPKVGLQKIRDFVTVLAGFMDSAAFNKLSGSQLMAKAQTDVGGTPLEGIQKMNEAIKDLAFGFADLTTDEQVTRGKQILDLEKQRQEAVLQYLYEIKTAQDALFKSIDAQMAEIGLTQMGPGAQRAALKTQLATVTGKIATAKTPQELTDLSSEAQTLIGRIFELSTSIPASLHGLIDGLKGLDDVLKPGMTPGEKLVDLSKKIADAGDRMAQATNVDDQVAAATDLLALTQERYALERQMLDEINSALKAMNASLDKQIHDMGLQGRLTAATAAGATPEEIANIQIADLLTRQQNLREELKHAGTAQEVERIVAELQQNASSLFDLMGKTPEAAAQLTKMLEDVRAQAAERFRAFTDQIQADNDVIRGRVTAAVGILEAALAGLPAAAQEAIDTLQTLKGLLATRFGELVDQIAAANLDIMGTIQEILDTLRSGLDGLFDPVTTTPTTGTGAGGGHPVLNQKGNDATVEPPVVNIGAPVVYVTISGTAEKLIEVVTAAAATQGARIAINAMQSTRSRAAGFA